MCSQAPKLRLKSIYPYLINGIKGGILMAAGDLFAQNYIEEKDWNNFDYERTARFALIGATFTAPLLTHWSSVMRRTISPTSAPLTIAIGKTLSTQMFLAPALNFGIITFSKLLNGVEPSKAAITNILKQEFPPIMEKSLMIWLPIQFTGHIIQCPSVKFFMLQAVSVLWFGHLSHLLMKRDQVKKDKQNPHQKPKQRQY